MQNRVYSVFLGDLTGDAMGRHYVDDTVDLDRARRLITTVSATCFVVATVLFIWGITQ